MFKWFKRKRDSNFKHVATRDFRISWTDQEDKLGYVHYDLYEDEHGNRKMITSTSGHLEHLMENHIETCATYKRVILPWLEGYVKWPGVLQPHGKLWTNDVGYDTFNAVVAVNCVKQDADEVEIEIGDEIDPVTEREDNIVTVDFKGDK